MPTDLLREVQDVTRRVAAVLNPGHVPVRIRIDFDSGPPLLLPVPVVVPASGAPVPDDFVPTATQEAILDALAGRALRTDALAAKCDCDRRTLFKANGIKELAKAGWVKRHPRLGYYRPDDPPPELEDEEGT